MFMASHSRTQLGQSANELVAKFGRSGYRYGFPDQYAAEFPVRPMYWDQSRIYQGVIGRHYPGAQTMRYHYMFDQNMYMQPGVPTSAGFGAAQNLTAQTSFPYETEATRASRDALTRTPNATHALVTFETDGRNSSVQTFESYTAAAEAYNNVVDAPGARKFAVVVDRLGDVWDRWTGELVQVFETRFRVPVRRPTEVLAWIIAGAASAVAGVALWRLRQERNQRRPRVRR